MGGRVRRDRRLRRPGPQPHRGRGAPAPGGPRDAGHPRRRHPARHSAAVFRDTIQSRGRGFRRRRRHRCRLPRLGNHPTTDRKEPPMRDAVIVDAVRTPIGKRDGTLSGVHAADLSAHVLTALVKRTGIDPGTVDDVLWGCVTQIGDQSSNIGRFAVLAAGWPEHVPGVTINRACGSSQQAVDSAAHAVMAGEYDLVVAGGVETMSRVPLGAHRTTGQPYGPAVLARYDNFEFNQGVGAELIAERWGFTRERVDEFAAGSHAKAAAAIDAGVFDDHVVPVEVDGTGFTTDEGLRRGTSVETLARLKPSFKPDGV